MSLIVVTGTGTGVGKTYVCRALHEALRDIGDVVALKPIESGFSGQGSDAECIGAGGPWSPPIYGLEEPLAPSVAARNAGVRISLERVATEVLARAEARRASGPDGLTPAATICVVESAGGLFTPLDDEARTNLDLVRLLEPCMWLLVAPNRLGVLGDLGAHLRAASSEHRMPDRVVLNGLVVDGSSESNESELRRLWPRLPFDSLGRDGAVCGPLVSALMGDVLLGAALRPRAR
jgi:dethiobiotin synthetase